MIPIVTEFEDDLKAFLSGMGFIEITPCVYWHKHFGRDFVFDFSDCNHFKYAIMYHIFEKVVEFGKSKRTNEVKRALGIFAEELQS